LPPGPSLEIGQAALLQSAAQPLQIRQLEPLDIDNRMAWQRGELVFEGEPLRRVLDEFSRYTNTRFTLASEELAEVRVGGYFKSGDVAGLLDTLSTSFHIRAEQVETGRFLLLPAD
ncbi:MAG TPA: FecR domain-containing protein, partial [Hyphomicrobiales bacterium]|nr:FecR domain-containing protein [Hyphomicrobiales bacterium]